MFFIRASFFWFSFTLFSFLSLSYSVSISLHSLSVPLFHLIAPPSHKWINGNKEKLNQNGNQALSSKLKILPTGFHFTAFPFVGELIFCFACTFTCSSAQFLFFFCFSFCTFFLYLFLSLSIFMLFLIGHLFISYTSYNEHLDGVISKCVPFFLFVLFLLFYAVEKKKNRKEMKRKEK